jgi:ABC-type phosphate transport system ATPase subunit
MQSYIHRYAANELQQSLNHNPFTALIGPRQCGKSTLVNYIELMSFTWTELALIMKTTGLFAR